MLVPLPRRDDTPPTENPGSAPWFGEWIGEWFGKKFRQRFGEKFEQMRCKTNIQYISGYDRSIQIYDIMAISFATASIKQEK